MHIKYLYRSYDLYREMLDFLHVSYDNDKPPISIIEKVKKYYPFYIKYIDDLDKPYYDPWASLLTRMDEYYELMSNNYKKDFFNEINRYQKFMRNHHDLDILKVMEELEMTKEEINKIEEILHEEIKFEDDYKIVISDSEINKLRENLKMFNERDQKVLDYRFGFTGKTHSILETSKKFSLPEIRIKQIEARCIRKINKLERKNEYC